MRAIHLAVIIINMLQMIGSIRLSCRNGNGDGDGNGGCISGFGCVQGFASKHRKKNLPLRKRPFKDTLIIEQDLHQRGFRFILGSDESGMGTLAGPLVAACCCILPSRTTAAESAIIDGVDDSKLLSKETRDRIHSEIMCRPDTFVWSVATRSSTEIDSTSLEQATQECFQECIEAVRDKLLHHHHHHHLDLSPTKDDDNDIDTDDDDGADDSSCLFYCIVDGHKSPGKLSMISARPLKRADEIVYTVALASIIARCHHETIMSDLAIQYPLYGFAEHGGYPTRDHIQALHQHGPSVVHRQLCKPVRDRQQQQQPSQKEEEEEEEGTT